MDSCWVGFTIHMIRSPGGYPGITGLRLQRENYSHKKHVLELYVFTSGLIGSVLKPIKNTVQKCLENQNCWKIAQIITTNIKFAEHYFRTRHTV